MSPPNWTLDRERPNTSLSLASHQQALKVLHEANGVYCSQKDAEVGDADSALMRCGQSLPARGHSQGLYPQSLHCSRPAPDLLLQDGPHHDTRSASSFQKAQLGASSSLGCSTNVAPSCAPYPVKQENSVGHKIPGVHGTSQAGFQAFRTGQVLDASRDEPAEALRVSSNGNGVCGTSCVSGDAVQPFNNEGGSSPLALSPSGSHHSARLLVASSVKRRCLSLASQSSTAVGTGSVASTSSPSATGTASEEINITTIICSSSPMSTVACINGFCANLSPSHTSGAGFSSSSSTSSTSPPSNCCPQEAPRRPPPHSSPQQATLQESCQLSSPAACLLSLSSSSSSSSASLVEPESGQGQSLGLCEEQVSMLRGRGGGGAVEGGVGGVGGERGSDGLGLLMMSGTLHSAPEVGCLLDEGQISGAALKQEPLDDFSPSEDELFHHHYHHHHHLGGRIGHHHHAPHPPRAAMPPPYHLHQYQGPNHVEPLQHQNQHTAQTSLLGLKPTSGDLPALHSVPEREQVGGGALADKQVCRWIDCSAAYEQQEELVRHIEKVHIDQRKGEDFTCFWAGCIRRYKPFNARYKLLIHMRVHSGEKPNKCMVSHQKPTNYEDQNLIKKIHPLSFPFPCLCSYKGTLNKPYACQISGCTKRYTDPSSLRKHVKIHSAKEQQVQRKLRPCPHLEQDILSDCLSMQQLQNSTSTQQQLYNGLYAGSSTPHHGASVELLSPTPNPTSVADLPARQHRLDRDLGSPHHLSPLAAMDGVRDG
uniref:Zinc finger protein GLIS1 n=1 Tax=Kryptolebias marmoratus TaxID=37003 RepID=A0A3Q2ZH54_KRYMA